MEDSTVGLVLSMRSWVHLGLAGESVQEAHVWEHSILILWVTQLSKKFLDILLRNLISKIAEDVVKLSKHHGTIAVFVIQLQQLKGQHSFPVSLGWQQQP